MYDLDQFIKITNSDGKNRGFQYKEGINEDINDLNTNDECGKGGLYFCRFRDFDKWFSMYGDGIVWKVDIPEGEEYIEYSDKLKAKRIILSEPKKIYEDYELCKIAIKTNGLALKFVKNQTEELCSLAVERDCWALQYVKVQTEDICKMAVRQNYWTIQYVKNQTEDICRIVMQCKQGV